MATRWEDNIRRQKERVICSQCKGNLSEIKLGDCISKESDGGNKDDLQNLQEDMKELRPTKNGCTQISKRGYSARN
jgi:hypothetical protein